MIEKKDWETALKQYEAMLINNLINSEAYEKMIEVCENKIKEYPEEEKDPMPEEIKEVIKEVKK